MRLVGVSRAVTREWVVSVGGRRGTLSEWSSDSEMDVYAEKIPCHHTSDSLQNECDWNKQVFPGGPLETTDGSGCNDQDTKAHDDPVCGPVSGF